MASKVEIERATIAWIGKNPGKVASLIQAAVVEMTGCHWKDFKETLAELTQQGLLEKYPSAGADKVWNVYRLRENSQAISDSRLAPTSNHESRAPDPAPTSHARTHDYDDPPLPGWGKTAAGQSERSSGDDDGKSARFRLVAGPIQVTAECRLSVNYQTSVAAFSCPVELLGDDPETAFAEAYDFVQRQAQVCAKDGLNKITSS